MVRTHTGDILHYNKLKYEKVKADGGGGGDWQGKYYLMKRKYMNRKFFGNPG